MKIVIEFDLSRDLRRFIESVVEAFALQSHTTDSLARSIEDVRVNQERMIQLMQEETRKVIKAFDDATNAIATRLEAFKAKAAEQGTMTEAEITAELTPILSRLQVLGSDERNPVPADSGGGGGAAESGGSTPA